MTRSATMSATSCCKKPVELQASLCEGDIIARLGGDKFAVFLPNSSRGRGNRTQPALRHKGASVDVDASIGIACFRNMAEFQLLMQHDVTMYAGKHSNFGYVGYVPGLD